MRTTTFVPGSQLRARGDGEFNGCRTVAAWELPPGVAKIGDGVVGGCNSLPLMTLGVGSRLQEIGRSALEGWAGLTAVTAPPEVAGIGVSAFCGRSSLKWVICVEGCDLEGVGRGAFDGWAAVAGMEVRPGVARAWALAFSGCSAVKSVPFVAWCRPRRVGRGGAGIVRSADGHRDVPRTVAEIGYEALGGCGGLRRVVFHGRRVAPVKWPFRGQLQRGWNWEEI